MPVPVGHVESAITSRVSGRCERMQPHVPYAASAPVVPSRTLANRCQCCCNGHLNVLACSLRSHGSKQPLPATCLVNRELVVPAAQMPWCPLYGSV